MKVLLKIDWVFVALTVGLFGLPWAVYGFNIDPRLMGWTLAAVAMAGMLWRLIGWFHDTPTGMRMFAAVMIFTLGVSAYAQWHFLGDTSVPFTAATYLLISQRLMCIGIAIYWTRWTGTNVSPFVRSER